MSNRIELERSIAAWMADEALGATDDRVLEQILTTTAAVRPEPRWLVLLKETPMRVNTRVAVGSPARRLVLIAAVTLLALSAAAAVAATLLQTAATDDWPAFAAVPPEPAWHALDPWASPSSNGGIRHPDRRSRRSRWSAMSRSCRATMGPSPA
jgi:hypothetical protein